MSMYYGLCSLSVILLTAQNKEGILPVATLFIALYVFRRFMSASDVAPEVTILSSALQTSINTPLSLKMYTSPLERTVNWVTLVSLLVEYLLYSVLTVTLV